MSTPLDLHRREATRLAELGRLGAARPEADRVLQELVDDAREALGAERSKDQHFRVRHGVRFYSGTPLITSGGHAIGSLCLPDTRPREFGEDG